MAIDQAGDARDQAKTHFALAIFHDNNSREAEAIPHYRAALALGLPSEDGPPARAWLASSLYKTGAPEGALEQVTLARAGEIDPMLKRFLDNLERRIRRNALVFGST